jgi:hypothetical protein
VHTDKEADHLARSVNAVAFTAGSDIFFREGAYNPGTTQGLQTLAHEAVHTVQQASGPVDGTPSTGGVLVSDSGDRFERAAAEAAHQIVSGAHLSFESITRPDMSSSVQRQATSSEDEAEKNKREEESDQAAD